MEDRPTEFSAKKGSKGFVYIFRRGKLPEVSEVDKAVDEERKRLAGTWEQVSFTDDGQEVPLPKTGRTRLTITDDGKSSRFTVRVEALRLSPVVRSVVQVTEGAGLFFFYPATNPKQVSVRSEQPRMRRMGAPPTKDDLPWHGIYELDGDTLRMCLVPSGKGWPTKLESKEGSGCALEVWKRVKE